jgi:hypothetical protein
LSTDDLVLSYLFLKAEFEASRREGLTWAAEEFSRRLKAVDAEIGARQLSLDDEVELLRRRNAQKGADRA